MDNNSTMTVQLTKGEITDNSQLIEVFKKMQKEGMEISDDTRMEFIDSFGKAQLIVPATIDPEPVDGKMQDGATFTFTMMETSEKLHYLITFSSLEEFKKWKKEEDKFALLTFDFQGLRDLLFEKAGGRYDGIVVDPKSSNFAVKNGFIKELSTIIMPGLKMNAEKMSVKTSPLTPAENIPDEVLRSLKDYCATNGDISKVYLMQTFKEGATEPTIVLVVDFESTNVKKVFDELALSIRSALKENQTIGMMPAKDPVAQEFIKDIEPAYTK